MADCTQNTDLLKLIREGTNQKERTPEALDPASAPVDEHLPAHDLMFVQAYSRFLQYYDLSNSPVGNWYSFFSEDVSVLLAIATIQNIENYRATVKEDFNFLNDLQNKLKTEELKNRLGFLFSYIATLARQLDWLKESLPLEIPLKASLQNRIQRQLAPALQRLLTTYKADRTMAAPHPLIAKKTAPLTILGSPAITFDDLYRDGLSIDWIADNSTDWQSYLNNNPADKELFGQSLDVFEAINHLATHNLFTGVFDQFLKVYARLANEAKQSLEATFTDWNRHQPHYALLIAFLRLFESVRAEGNKLTARHLDFYFRRILQLKERPANPGQAHLLIELAKHVEAREIGAGTLFNAGKDDRGNDAFFANDRNFVANRATIAALKNVYRHGSEKVGNTADAENQEGRLFAAPIANSRDGMGAPITTPDQSWHPFFNKTYQNEALVQIAMPPAEIGFAIASHYLLMAEGERAILLEVEVSGYEGKLSEDFSSQFTCLVTSEKGWIEKTDFILGMDSDNTFIIYVVLSGEDPAITPYQEKTHGYDFDTTLPVLLVKFKPELATKSVYPNFQDVVISKITLMAGAQGLKSLKVSNDFGPVDISKPFQPFGPSPVMGSSLIIGSREIFQKSLVEFQLSIDWLTTPAPYGTASPKINIDILESGSWATSVITSVSLKSTTIDLTGKTTEAIVDRPDLEADEYYGTASRHGFIRLRLDNDFGQSAYQTDLLRFIRKEINDEPKPHPVGPSIGSLSAAYSASQTIALNSSNQENFKNRQARFFHLAPFGQAEQHPALNTSGEVSLFPQFKVEKNNSAAEFYLGISGLQPPQNLSVLFQVADGTANPLASKPQHHLHWSYLRNNQWFAFGENEVEDQTGGLLNSGIVTFAIPREASKTNTILPAGLHWIRVAVTSQSDAVCRLIAIAAQALKASFADHDNDPAFSGKLLPTGTINKLDRPDAAVKKIVQPFATFGGRVAESPAHFYTRISERLRHKDRAIALWDYERIILETFPQIYQAKCLNHTWYESNPGGQGIYRELAPGHVTIVTIPNLQGQNLRDSLRPFTSLGLLQEIKEFLQKRLSCFVKLHVENPQFEEVRADFKVRLREGFDQTFYLRKLHDDITQFLSPWAFPGGGSPSFSGKIYKSALINFVEERAYVDYVTDFQLFHDIGDVRGNLDRNDVEGSKAVSILVSARQHNIQPLKITQGKSPGENCSCEA